MVTQKWIQAGKVFGIKLVRSQLRVPRDLPSLWGGAGMKRRGLCPQSVCPSPFRMPAVINKAANSRASAVKIRLATGASSLQSRSKVTGNARAPEAAEILQAGASKKLETPCSVFFGNKHILHSISNRCKTLTSVVARAAFGFKCIRLIFFAAPSRSA